MRLGHDQPAVRLARIGVSEDEELDARGLQFRLAAQTALALLHRFRIVQIAVAAADVGRGTGRSKRQPER